MMASRLYLVLLFLLISATFLNTVYACNNQSLTLERCEKPTDCVGFNPQGNIEALCMGRNTEGDLAQCPDDDVALCVCFPAGFKGCSRHDQCPDETYCGISPRTGNSVCTGCLSFDDKEIDFKPVGGKLPSNRCKNRQEHPPCGTILDFCSPTMPCAIGRECVGYSGNELYGCASSETPCLCSIPIAGGENSIITQMCNVNEDCPDPREACVHDTTLNLNYCASCDAARFTSNLLVNDTAKCDVVEVPRRAPNHYPISPNGRTYDFCAADDQCTNGRKCVEFDDEDDSIPKKIKPCSSLENLCFCRKEALQACTTGMQCQKGESCLNSTGIDADKHCVTNAIIDALSNRNYEIIGKERPNPDGTRLTNEDCRFDWDCKAPRRCTHVLETFGGCAGRKACTCKQLTQPECKSNNNCPSGEACVKFSDARSKAFCTSKKLLGGNGFLTYVPVNSKAPKPTPISSSGGLTQDLCLTNADCVGNRTCQHFTESSGGCNGRYGCWCTFDSPVSCNFTSDCEKGEVCVSYKGVFPSDRKECVSRSAFDSETDSFRRTYPFTLKSPGPSPTKAPKPSKKASSAPTPSSSPAPITEPTFSSLPDPEESIEATETNEVVPPSPDSTTEFVSPSPTSTSEVVDGPGLVPEDSIEPSQEPDGDSICIDIKLLKNVPKEDLVFKQARRGAVLCDHVGSCATPGHMVVFNGVAMSMKSYCSKHVNNGCEKRVTMVNSPKMKYGLRISSLTNNLHMTAHAARYESWIEEAFLSRAINHLGL